MAAVETAGLLNTRSTREHKGMLCVLLYAERTNSDLRDYPGSTRRRTTIAAYAAAHSATQFCVVIVAAESPFGSPLFSSVYSRLQIAFAFAIRLGTLL